MFSIFDSPLVGCGLLLDNIAVLAICPCSSSNALSHVGRLLPSTLTVLLNYSSGRIPLHDCRPLPSSLADDSPYSSCRALLRVSIRPLSDGPAVFLGISSFFSVLILFLPSIQHPFLSYGRILLSLRSSHTLFSRVQSLLAIIEHVLTFSPFSLHAAEN